MGLPIGGRSLAGILLLLGVLSVLTVSRLNLAEWTDDGGHVETYATRE
jgi:hypothetical protein